MTGKPKKKPRGLAALTPERQAEIGRLGGKAAHANGAAHRFTSEEAAKAGRMGGAASHAKGTSHQFAPAEARAAGKKGLKARKLKKGIS